MGKTMRTDRRGFLCGAAAFAAAVPISGFPAIVKRRGANMLLSHACIGCGNMALADLNGLRSHRDIHITALCDVDSEILEKARRLCPEARVYRNAFEMMAAEGNRIDSVNVSTPDHTHAAYILDALGRGLNVYGQKPLCHRLEESRRIESLAAEKGAVTQMGTQIAAWECDRQTAEALRSGKIGEVRHVWLFSNRRKAPPDSKYALPVKEDPVPSTLDWKTWLGDAAYRPYSVGNYHPQVWRKWRDFGSSWLGDLALHLLSPVWIGLELGKTGPLDVRAEISDDGWTPEQLKANVWPQLNGRRYPWEACYTFSSSWGYHRDEATWKSVHQCLDLLIGAVAHGGNLMLNVGPTGRGTFDYRATDRLRGIAAWMEVNGRSIHGCTEAPADIPPMPGTELTYNPKTNRLYIHLLQYPSGPLGMRFASKVAYSQFLHDASEIKLEPLPPWQRKGDPNGYDAYFKLPVVKPPVEVPVIEVMLGAGGAESGANDNQS